MVITEDQLPTGALVFCYIDGIPDTPQLFFIKLPDGRYQDVTLRGHYDVLYGDEIWGGDFYRIA
jgi:hypothetical protein